MQTIRTIFLGSFGALAAWSLGAPAPFLTGPATFVTFCALLKIDCNISLTVRNVSFIIIGISTAEEINSNVFHHILAWPISLIGMSVSVIILVFTGRYIFETYFKMEKNTATLASTPGHLSYVLSLSEGTNANTAVISVIQSIRVLTLTLAVPTIITLFTNFEVQTAISNEEVLSISHLIFLVVFSSIFGLLLLKFRVPAAFLVGGMFCSTLGHGFNLTPGLVPDNLTIMAFIILGSLIGSRFSGISVETFRSCVFQGSVFTVLSFLISAIFAFLISQFTSFGLMETLIAIAPGGLETMVVMGQLIGADPAFIAFHHLARLFLLLFLLSVMVK